MSDDKKVEKPAATKSADQSLREAIADAVTKALSEALPLSAGIMAKTMVNTQRDNNLAQLAANAALRPTGETCEKCKQFLPAGMTAETHPHRFIAVYPANARKHGRWFQGVWINGIRYLSNSQQHKIYVPADANIEHLVEVWEDNEDELQTGREKDHDSGNIRNPIPANVGWR